MSKNSFRNKRPSMISTATDAVKGYFSPKSSPTSIADEVAFEDKEFIEQKYQVQADYFLEEIVKSNYSKDSLENLSNFLDQKPLVNEKTRNKILGFAEKRFEENPELITKIVKLIAEQNPNDKSLLQQVSNQLIHLSNERSSTLSHLVILDDLIKELPTKPQEGYKYGNFSEQEIEAITVLSSITYDKEKLLSDLSKLKESGNPDFATFKKLHELAKILEKTSLQPKIRAQLNALTIKFTPETLQEVEKATAEYPENAKTLQELAELASKSQVYQEYIGASTNDQVTNRHLMNVANEILRSSLTPAPNYDRGTLLRYNEFLSYSPKLGILGTDEEEQPSEKSATSGFKEKYLGTQALEIAIENATTCPELINTVLEQHKIQILEKAQSGEIGGEQANEKISQLCNYVLASSIHTENMEQREILFNATKDILYTAIERTDKKDLLEMIEDASTKQHTALLDLLAQKFSKDFQTFEAQEGLLSLKNVELLYEAGKHDTIKIFMHSKDALQSCLNEASTKHSSGESVSPKLVKLLFEESFDGKDIRFTNNNIDLLIHSAASLNDEKMILNILESTSKNNNKEAFNLAIDKMLDNHPTLTQKLKIALSTPDEPAISSVTASLLMENKKFIDSLDSTKDKGTIETIARFYSPASQSEQILAKLLDSTYTKKSRSEDLYNSLSLKFINTPLLETLRIPSVKEALKAYAETRNYHEQKPILTSLKALISGKWPSTYKNEQIEASIGKISSNIRSLNVALEPATLTKKSPETEIIQSSPMEQTRITIAEVEKINAEKRSKINKENLETQKASRQGTVIEHFKGKKKRRTNSASELILEASESKQEPTIRSTKNKGRRKSI